MPQAQSNIDDVVKEFATNVQFGFHNLVQLLKAAGEEYPVNVAIDILGMNIGSIIYEVTGEGKENVDAVFENLQATAKKTITTLQTDMENMTPVQFESIKPGAKTHD